MDKLATFRVKPEQWQAFQALCKESGTNASAVLHGHLQACLDSQSVGKVIEVSPITRSEFDSLRDELGELRDELGKSEAA